MQPGWILLPMLGMFLLTVFTALRMLKLRYRAVLKEGLPVAYFRHNRGAEPSDALVQTTQHYENLFETPVLFYAVVLTIHQLQYTDWVAVTLAWAYVAARVRHAQIHMGANKVLKRRDIFLVSFALLIALWIYTFAVLLWRLLA